MSAKSVKKIGHHEPCLISVANVSRLPYKPIAAIHIVSNNIDVVQLDIELTFRDGSNHPFLL